MRDSNQIDEIRSVVRRAPLAVGIFFMVLMAVACPAHSASLKLNLHETHFGNPFGIFANTADGAVWLGDLNVPA